MSLPQIFAVLCWLCATYTICSVPFGLVVASKRAGVDVRSVGSGNIGTTNVARTAGASSAGITLLLDAGKGFFCTFLFRPILYALPLGFDRLALEPSSELGIFLALVFLTCIVGHVFSVFLKFSGGKGIAVGFGASLGVAWPLGAFLLLVFCCFAIPTRYVSLGSCAAALSLPILCWVFLKPTLPFMATMCVACLIVVWAHRENIARLIHGEESKFSFKRD